MYKYNLVDHVAELEVIFMETHDKMSGEHKTRNFHSLIKIS